VVWQVVEAGRDGILPLDVAATSLPTDCRQNGSRILAIRENARGVGFVSVPLFERLRGDRNDLFRPLRTRSSPLPFSRNIRVMRFLSHCSCPWLSPQPPQGRHSRRLAGRYGFPALARGGGVPAHQPHRQVMQRKGVRLTSLAVRGPARRCPGGKPGASNWRGRLLEGRPMATRPVAPKQEKAGAP